MHVHVRVGLGRTSPYGQLEWQAIVMSVPLLPKVTPEDAGKPVSRFGPGTVIEDHIPRFSCLGFFKPASTSIERHSVVVVEYRKRVRFSQRTSWTNPPSGWDAVEKICSPLVSLPRLHFLLAISNVQLLRLPDWNRHVGLGSEPGSEMMK